MTSSIEKVPNELLLEICDYLRPARLLSRHGRPRSLFGLFALTHKDQDVYEDGLAAHESFGALSALCLTSKRLNSIATPQLYAHFITEGPSARSIRQLFEFMEVLVRHPALGLHVKYIAHDFNNTNERENYKRYFKRVRWPAHRRRMEKVAASIWPAEMLLRWVELYEQHAEQAQIVLLLALTPNVSHVFVDIFEPATAIISTLLGWNNSAQGEQSTLVRIHQFERLEILDLVSHSTGDPSSPLTVANGPHPFRQILQALAGFPKLRCYQHGQAGYYVDNHDAIRHLGTQILLLESVRLENCYLTLQGVAAMLKACESLKCLEVQQGEEYEGFDFARLYPDLRRHKETLELIDLSFGGSYGESKGPHGMGSFSDFNKLRLLGVPITALVGYPDDIDWENDPDYE